MSRAPEGDALVIGGEPRVDLLPPEVRSRKKARRARRRLGILLVIVVLVVVGGVTAASSYAATARQALIAAQARTDALLAQQTTYLSVEKLQSDIALVTLARASGASTEINWESYLNQLQALLPADVSIQTVAVDSAPPFEAYAQATAPLQLERVATIKIALTSPNLSSMPTWLAALTALPGYADDSPGSINETPSGGFQMVLTLHINSGAFSDRFASSATKEK
jgi:Tfp pilus assembly protein PilN